MEPLKFPPPKGGQIIQPNGRPATGCKTCKFKAMQGQQGQTMVCTFNPPTAAPLMGLNAKGEVAIQGWAASFPPVHPDLKCGQYKLDDRG